MKNDRLFQLTLSLTLASEFIETKGGSDINGTVKKLYEKFMGGDSFLSESHSILI